MEGATDLFDKAAARHGIVTVDDLTGAGISPAQVDRWIASGRLRLLGRGTYRVGGAPATYEGEILAAILVLPVETWASHRCAAWLWELPGFEARQLIELTRTVRLSVRRHGVRMHRSTLVPAHHVTVRRGIPTTTISRTIFDLARTVPSAHLERVIEAALRGPSCSITSLYRVFHDLGGRGRPGSARMRECLEWRGERYVPTESELDLVGRAVLREVVELEHQVEVSDERGYIRRVDALHRASGLVVEWDGDAFHSTPQQRRLDREQDARLRALGLEVVRFGWTDVRSGDPVRSRVLQHIAASAA